MEGALLINDGPVRKLSVEEAAQYRGEGFLWIHIEGRDEHELAFLKEQQDIPEIAAGALVATETRPRCDRIEEGAIVNLRGPGELDTADSDRLVSIRLWVRRNRVTSLSRRTMNATAAVAELVEAGRIIDPGDLVAAFARQISRELDPQVAGLGDTLDDCESALESGSIYKLRSSIAQIRSEAIAFRRFVAPDRDALTTLAAMDVDWLEEQDRLHINEAADRFARMTEELEAVRERAALLHEQLTDLRAEQVDQRALVISIVAFIFLPLTFITGLLGMNVQGIPYADRPWAFWGVVAFCVLVGLIVLAWFSEEALAQAVTEICFLCGRPLGRRLEWHHPIPKSRGGRDTAPVHPICHRTIHATLTNRELERGYASAAALRTHPEIARFVDWVRDKDPDFHAPTRRRKS